MSARSVGRRLVHVPAGVLIALVRVYQIVLSPLTPPTCRYYPSCSAYAVTALRRHGALRGTWLTVRRLARCHPWAPGGCDDVPPARQRTSRTAVPTGSVSHHPDVVQTTH